MLTWGGLCSIQEYTEPLFRTTHALVDRLAKDAESKGSVDFVRCVTQWAFDTAVRIRSLHRILYLY